MLAMKTYEDILVNARCRACPANTELEVGSVSVFDCQCVSGSVGSPGRACSMGCDAGSNIVLDQISGKYTCVPCVVGTYKTDFGMGTCTKGDEGKFGKETGGMAESQCLSCTALQFSSAGADECRNCPLNAKAWSNGATCTCNDGYVGYGTV